MPKIQEQANTSLHKRTPPSHMYTHSLTHTHTHTHTHTQTHTIILLSHHFILYVYNYHRRKSWGHDWGYIPPLFERGNAVYKHPPNFQGMKDVHINNCSMFFHKSNTNRIILILLFETEKNLQIFTFHFLWSYLPSMFIRNLSFIRKLAKIGES